MEKQTKIEMTLDVYGWIMERERIMNEIETRLHQLFVKHRILTGDHRSTGCFHVELSLPKAEILPDSYDIEARTSQTIQVVDKLDMNAAKKRKDYWCCAAPFGVHEPDCKNYIQVCTRDHICVLASSGPCNGFPREK